MSLPSNKQLITVGRIEKLEQRNKLAAHIKIDYPEVNFGYSTSQVIKYRTALDESSDLKQLKNPRLIILAYEFRKEQIREYCVDHTTEYANGRCNISLGGYKQNSIPGNLLSLKFEKECVVCFKYEKGINLCPNCWQIIRKCLDLKGKSHREGWEGWGYEMHLDLEPLIRLLKEDGELRGGK